MNKIVVSADHSVKIIWRSLNPWLGLFAVGFSNKIFPPESGYDQVKKVTVKPKKTEVVTPLVIRASCDSFMEFGWNPTIVLSDTFEPVASFNGRVIYEKQTPDQRWPTTGVLRSPDTNRRPTQSNDAQRGATSLTEEKYRLVHTYSRNYWTIWFDTVTDRWVFSYQNAKIKESRDYGSTIKALTSNTPGKLIS